MKENKTSWGFIFFMLFMIVLFGAGAAFTDTPPINKGVQDRPEGVDSTYIIYWDSQSRPVGDHMDYPVCTKFLNEIPCHFTLYRYLNFRDCGVQTIKTMDMFQRQVRPELGESYNNLRILSRCVATDNMRPGSSVG